jgi:hypothetical protein
MNKYCTVLVPFGFLALLSVTVSANAQGGIGSLGGGLSGIPGSPYCGTRESETTQTLFDGTHITRKSKTHVCRDSQGRTRTEMFVANGQGEVSQNPVNINIVDPVEHVQYMLDVNRHSARRIVQSFPTPPPPQQIPPPSQQIPPPPPISVPQQPRAETKMELLDSQMMEGLLVDGIRNTTIIPVGLEGNDRPMVIVNEVWSSRELHEVVRSKRTDPRSGDATESLSGIDRSEPDLAIFRVPADYTIEDVPSPFVRR